MTDIGKAIRTRLAADAAVAADVGTRIFPRAMPQDATLPAIVYQLVSSTSDDAIGGAAGMATALLQVDVYADTHLAANNTGEDIRAALHGFTGTIGSETIRGLQLQNKMELYQVPNDGGDDGVYRVTLDWSITHTESVPTF